MKSYRYEVCTFTAAKEDAFCLFREKFKLYFLKKRITGLKVLVSASVECCYLFCMLKAGNLKYEVTNSLACLVINLLRLLTFVSSIQSIAICIETLGIHVYKLKYSQTYVTPSV